MDNEAWEKCPSTANAIECRNTGCKQKQPIPLKMAMINIYILDEAVSAKLVRQQGILWLKRGKGNIWLRFVLTI